jgi:hypothetical protein
MFAKGMVTNNEWPKVSGVELLKKVPAFARDRNKTAAVKQP